jgi:hypothetical protein
MMSRGLLMSADALLGNAQDAPAGEMESDSPKAADVGSVINLLTELLLKRQLRSGGWSFFGSRQSSIEATSLAVLALGFGAHAQQSGIAHLLDSQRPDGGWPAFIGDSESCWTTALALCALNATGDFELARKKALHWLDAERGREAHWLWRWKFKTVDRNVHFDPDKYGWPWGPGAASWVMPTALSIIAIKQYTVCNRDDVSDQRIRVGIQMLLDRGCVGGGWNSGNSVVYGVPLLPHVETTAIALLALQEEEGPPVVRAGLAWLRNRAASIESAESLAWCILSLFVYREPVEQLKRVLATKVGEGLGVQNAATVATALLALKCGEIIHPFVVLR